MRIEIVVHADLLCPWSFVGKRSLEAAMYRYKMRHPDVEFEVVWKPFLLYPMLRYIDKRALYAKIMGTDQLRTFIDGVQAAGVRHGVDFTVHGATGPSQRGHRLAAMALRTLGPVAQGAVIESIFRGHFEHGRDLADAKWLMSVGSGVGLEPKAVLNALDCQVVGHMLDDELTAAAASGVIAVPSILIGARFRVAGYQNPDLFEGAFDRLRKEREQGLAAMNQAMRCDRLGRGDLAMSMQGVGPDGGRSEPARGDQTPPSQCTVSDEGGQEPPEQAPGRYRLIRPATELTIQRPGLYKVHPRSVRRRPGPDTPNESAPQLARQEPALGRADPGSSGPGLGQDTLNRPAPQPIRQEPALGRVDPAPPSQGPGSDTLNRPAPQPARQESDPNALDRPAPQLVRREPALGRADPRSSGPGLGQDTLNRPAPQPTRQEPALGRVDPASSRHEPRPDTLNKPGPVPVPARHKPASDRVNRQGPDPNTPNRPAPQPARLELALGRIGPAPSRQGPDPNTLDRPAPQLARQAPALGRVDSVSSRQGPGPDTLNTLGLGLVPARQGPPPHREYPQPVQRCRELDREIWGMSRDDGDVGPSRGIPAPSRQGPSLTGGKPRSLKRGRELDREIWGLDSEEPERRVGGGPPNRW